MIYSPFVVLLMSRSGKLVLVLISLLSLCHADERFTVNVVKNGKDTTDCLQGGKTPCLTIDYVLRNLLQQQRPSVRIVVSTNQTLPSSEGYISWTPSVTIIGKKGVTFRCNDGVSLFLNFIYANTNSIFRMRGLHFENCRTDDDGIGFIVAYLKVFIAEDCTFRDGGVVSLALVEDVTVSNCVFERLNGTMTPVLVYMATSIIAAVTSEKQSIVIRNSQIINNRGLLDNSTNSHNVGNGMMIFDLNGLQRNYSIHYDIIVENCTIANNSMKGRILPIFRAEKSNNVSVNFTIVHTNFTNNSAPPTILLGSDDHVDVELNVLDSVFQNSSMPLDRYGIQVMQSIDSSGSSTNTLRTNIKRVQFGDIII